LAHKFDRLKGFAITSFGAISEALAAGDIGAAANVLWATLRVAFQKGVNVLKGYWLDFKEFFVSRFTDSVYGILVIANQIWAGIQKGIATVKAAWANAINEITSIWRGFQNEIQGQAERFLITQDFESRIKSIDESEASGSMRSDIAEQQRQMLRKAYQEDIGAVDTRKNERADKIETDRVNEFGRINNTLNESIDKTNAELEKSLVAISDAAENDHKARKAQYAKELQQSQSALDKAKKAWREAVKDTGEATSNALGDDGASTGGGGLAERIKALQDGVAGISPTLDSQASKLDISGGFGAVFQAFAANQKDSTAEKTARFTEAVAQNTGRLVDAFEESDGGLVLGG